MKLMYCIDCKTMTNIDIFTRVCNCTHSYCKRYPNSTKVIVYGPCRVYAINDEKLETGMAKIWKLKKDCPGVVRTTELDELRNV